MRRPVPLVLAAPVAAALLLVGCDHSSGGPRVASASHSGSSIASLSAGSGKSNPIAYSRCMRTHGISDFPDPNSGGGFTIKNEPGSDLDPKNPQYKAAANACKKLAPQRPPVTDKDRAASLKFSQCMRAHGIKDFPDPSSDGQIMLGKPGQGAANSDLTPDNPQFKAAQQACNKYMPGGGDQQTVSGGQGNGG